MQVLVLSWEFPPNLVGGLGRHVDRLTAALAGEGHDVHVLTRGDAHAPAVERVGQVKVHRVPDYAPFPPADAFVPGVLQANLAMGEHGLGLIDRLDVDVLHAHDWLVAYAADMLRQTADIPVVATVHATEYGRHQGWLPGDMNRFIHQVEWWLTYVARRVITCSRFMHDEVQRIFELPPEKLDVVPNGLALPMGDARPEVAHADLGRAAPTVLFTGRLEYEKGVQTLVQAAPAILRAHPGARFVVAGTGTHEQNLRREVYESGLSDSFRFLGFVGTEELPDVYRAASVVVVPSLYEPFGMVALEAMAARTPVVVSDTGGLRELVQHDVDGLRVPPGEPAALAASVIKVLDDADLARRLVGAGVRTVAARSWRLIARRTARIYAKAVREDVRLRGEEALEPPTPLRRVWAESDAFRAVLEPRSGTADVTGM